MEEKIRPTKKGVSKFTSSPNVKEFTSKIRWEWSVARMALKGSIFLYGNFLEMGNL
jgi:hypothetical protein